MEETNSTISSFPVRMKLFHLSNVAYPRLEPQLGSTRNGGEDPRAVGVPVVWLSNSQAMRREGPNGEVPEFQLEVEVPEDDPHLFLGEPFAKLMEAGVTFGSDIPLRWYFVTRSVDVAGVRHWDPALNDYVT
jgi:hypothetical protein